VTFSFLLENLVVRFHGLDREAVTSEGLLLKAGLRTATRAASSIGECERYYTVATSDLRRSAAIQLSSMRRP
jgi:hypothetical protein